MIFVELLNYRKLSTLWRNRNELAGKFCKAFQVFYLICIFFAESNSDYRCSKRITDERKKKFLIPNNPLAASVIGIAFRKENDGQIKDLESFAKFSGKLIPISPQSAQFSVIQEFNEKHPANQIKLVPSDVFDIADSYLWVLEGRYDAYFVLKLSYEKNVIKETGPYHQFADKLSYVPYKGIPTWPLFNKKEVELAAAYDKAVQTLKENGTISKLSLKYFGEDVFNFVSE